MVIVWWYVMIIDDKISKLSLIINSFLAVYILALTLLLFSEIYYDLPRVYANPHHQKRILYLFKRAILIDIRYYDGFCIHNKLIDMFFFILFLQAVYLYANVICQINASAFSGLPKLSILNLKANRLIAPPSLIFIRATLKHLDMSQNNLTYIPKLYFYGCPVLEMIFLSNNKLSAIPNLECVAINVRGINLDANRIFDVVALYDNKYPRLRILKLNGNNLREFCLPSHEFMPRLDELMLHGNELTTIQLPDMPTRRYTGFADLRQPGELTRNACPGCW